MCFNFEKGIEELNRRGIQKGEKSSLGFVSVFRGKGVWEENIRFDQKSIKGLDKLIPKIL